MALIEREAAIAAIREHGTLSGGYYSDTEIEDNVVDMLEDLPTIDAAPVVHGRVLVNGNPICGPCSKCGESVNRKWNYCPNCGARMDGGVEDAD